MYPHTLEYGNFHITPQLDSNSLHKYPTNPPQFPCNSPANPPTKCRPACGQMPFHTPLHPQMHTPLRKDIPPAMKYNLPFTQSRLRLLGQKNNLDGELLLLAILRMSNVVRQAPSQDDCFFTLPYRLILHSFRANHFLSGGCPSSCKAMQRQWATKYPEVA